VAWKKFFIIIDGRVEIIIDEKHSTLASGDAVVIPAKAVHEMKAVGEKDAVYIVIGIV